MSPANAHHDAMKDSKPQRSREILKQIHDVLWNDWDPIGVRGDGPEDEYDGYIGGVYRLLATGAGKQALVDYLISIETGSMGLSPVEKRKREPVAKRLLELDVSLGTE